MTPTAITPISAVNKRRINVSLVNIERIGKGLRTSLPELFRRI